MDGLTFVHSGNRLTSLTDSQATGDASGAKAFTYDANGNLTRDGRQDLEIRWNLLNLASGAETHDGSLTFARLSDGMLVSSQKTSGSNTTGKRYCGSFIFTTGTGITTPQVESVAWDEGRIFRDAQTGTYRDCWYAGDHLGNVRSVVDISTVQSSPVVLEQNDYLPFGTRIENPHFTQLASNRWRYAGKEEYPELNLLDFGARMYDPFTARWTAVDPLARKYTGMSPYGYCYGDPLRYADPDGRDGWDKTVGYAIGIITNIIPGSSTLRDLYSPNDSEDYNGALKSCDNAALVVGEAMSKGGMLMAGTGAAVTGVGIGMMGTGGAIMLSGVGAPEGGAVMVGGAEVTAVGAKATAAGVSSTAAGMGLMKNANVNSSQGYGRGKRGGETSYTKTGREAHRNYDPGPGYKKEFTLRPTRKRVDAVNRKEGIVRELKPNNPRAIKRGQKQVQEYVDILNRTDPLPDGRSWQGFVDTY